MKHINVGDLVKEHKCHEGKDDDFDSLILDEDKLLDLMVRMRFERRLIVETVYSYVFITLP